MANSPATATDLQNRSLRTLSAQELTVGSVMLEDAWNIIVSARPSVDSRLDLLPLNAVLQNLVIQVQCAMVLRVLANPDGKLEESIDDYKWRIDSARSTGALYVSDAELALLGAGDDASDGAWTIKPAGFMDRSWASTWVDAGSAVL